MFSDIGDGHEYVETVKRGEGDETTTTKSTIAFCDYATAMGADWKTFSMKRRKRMPDAYFALASLAHDGDWGRFAPPTASIRRSPTAQVLSGWQLARVACGNISRVRHRWRDRGPGGD